VHTRWIETEWAGDLEPFAGPAREAGEPAERETVVVEVGGRRLEVTLPAGLGAVAAASAGGRGAPKRSGSRAGGAAAGGDALTSPMQGTIVRIAVTDGDRVEAGDLVVVLEAMKMENPVTAHKAGTVTGLSASAGSSVSQGTVLCEIKD
jgi:acetyl-CoA/propionyl-CoA carboxylase, biotin carboxylase, biotin carboxyl carrier protein